MMVYGKFIKIYRWLLLLVIIAVLVECILEDTTRDLEVCKRACKEEFFPMLFNFISDKRRDNSLFNDLKPAWSTCQYRCYRCRIPAANLAMETLEWKFAHDQQSLEGSYVKLLESVSRVEFSVSNCIKVWDFLNRRGNETSVIN